MSDIAVATDRAAKADLRHFVQDDLFRSKHVVDAAVASDGGTIFYQLLETVGDKNDGTERKRSSIWRLDPGSGDRVEITAWASDAFAPVLTFDGNLFFLASRETGAPPQLFRLALKTEELSTLTSLEGGVISFAIAPDGRHVALVAGDPRIKSEAPKTHIRITSLNYRCDPLGGYIQDAPQALHVMPIDGGTPPKVISPYDGLISALAWSPDSSRIAYVVNVAAKSRRFVFFGDLFVSDIEGNRTTLIENEAVVSPFWTAAGDEIVFASLPEGKMSRQPQLWTVDCRSGEKHPRTGKLDLPVMGLFQVNNPTFAYPGRFLREGDKAIVSVAHGGEIRICRVALEGPEAVEVIASGPFVARPLALSGNMLLIARQDCLHPAELWSVDLETGEQCALTDHNSGWQSEIAWPDIEAVPVACAGVTIEAWLLKPAGAQAPYPTILYIHGGPHAGFGYSFNEDFQELVGAGYAVLYANPRGSTGYGDAFAQAIIGRWGEPEFEDFMTLLDDLVARKLIDPDRLGVTGVSGGGHLSAWLMMHTDRFKAAVPEQGVYSMLSFYGTSDAGIDLASVEMGGHPHEHPERYWALSPIAHAHKCKTPALLIQGENDLRCPMEQAEQLYTILKYNGCEVELLRLRDCKHGTEMVDVPALRRIRMDAMKDWFARFIP